MTEVATAYPENGHDIDDVDRILYDLAIFDVASEGDEAQQKLRELCTAILDPDTRVELRVDFDKTLTTWDSPNTWQAAYLELSPDPKEGSDISLREESDIDRIECMRLQEQGQLGDEAMDAWTLRELRRHIKNGTTQEALERRSKEEIEFRKGVARLFELTSILDIEPIIASAGFGNVVHTTLKASGIEIPRENIISNWFDVTNTEDTDVIVNSGNKREHIERQFPILDGQVRYVAAFGDSITDQQMTDGDGVSIRPRGPKANTDEYMRESREASFDLVLRHDNLYGLVALFTKIVDVAQERRKENALIEIN